MVKQQSRRRAEGRSRMSGLAEDRNGSPTMLVRTEEIQQQIQQLSGRDLQLWSIGILVTLVLLAGFLSLVVPNIVWAQRVVHLDQAYLPQLFFGLISMIVLFNVYIVGQKVTLNSTRRKLIRELVLNERLESLSLVDPLTQMLNRRAVDELVPTEVARANRVGCSLTFMAVEINNLVSINGKYGSLEGDFVLVEFAKILKLVFRGGDVVFRQAKEQFLVMMPDTDERQAEFPIQRLMRELEQWNRSNNKAYELAVTYALSTYATGTDFADSLRDADRKLFQKRNKLVSA